MRSNFHAHVVSRRICICGSISSLYFGNLCHYGLSYWSLFLFFFLWVILRLYRHSKTYQDLNRGVSEGLLATLSQRFRNKNTKLNICHHMLTSSTQLQNRSFYIVERTTTSTKCLKIKTARAKRAKLFFFIVKYANL